MFHKHLPVFLVLGLVLGVDHPTQPTNESTVNRVKRDVIGSGRKSLSEQFPCKISRELVFFGAWSILPGEGVERIGCLGYT